MILLGWMFPLSLHEVSRGMKQMATSNRRPGQVLKTSEVLESLLNSGCFGQSASGGQRTKDEQEQQPEDKYRVQTADEVTGELVVAGLTCGHRKSCGKCGEDAMSMATKMEAQEEAIGGIMIV